MKILLVEPFFTGSHKQWVCGFQQASQHEVRILSLPGRHWKWRMYGAAVQLAQEFQQMNFEPDLILVTDMLDCTTFITLCKNRIQDKPIVLYFHENQITYPWSPTDEDIKLQRNNQYGFINYTSALAADRIFFNSVYHLSSFVNRLPGFLNQFPDYQGLENVKLIREKSAVLPLGLNLKTFDPFKNSEQNDIPVILWNHRWEYDKNPEDFYQALSFLKKEALDFQLIVLGESYRKAPKVFENIKTEFGEHLLHFGYADSFESYARWLWKADILPVTSNQDFFGGSVVEAIYCQNIPILPDRLAYPEHIPEEFQNKYLYKTPSDFQEKLRQSVINFSSNKDNQRLSDFVARYDWGILATQYDFTFQDILDSNRN